MSSLFFGLKILVFVILIGCQPIAAADITNSSADIPVAFTAGSLTFLFGIVTFGVLVMVMTAIFSLLVGYIRERKNRFIILGILFILVVFKDLSFLLLTGTDLTGITGFVTSLLHIIGMCKFPLVIILTGMLWFWPENKISWKDSALCSAFVFIVGMVIWELLALTGILPRLFAIINDISHTPPANPEIQALILFSLSIIGLVLTLILSWLGFWVIAKYREKKKKTE